jgi:hypothetical protein
MTYVEQKAEEFIELFEKNERFRDIILDYLFQGPGSQFKRVQNELDFIKKG